MEKFVLRENSFSKSFFDADPDWMRPIYESESAMRRYIRHPSDIPIAFKTGEDSHEPRLKDVSRGGLCFSSDCPLKKGCSIHIEIPLESMPFQADGTVAWCRPDGQHYAVGIQFSDQSTRFSVRMVEQICHIEHYRAQVKNDEARDLTSEEAAKEWVEKFAADFPPAQDD